MTPIPIPIPPSETGQRSSGVTLFKTPLVTPHECNPPTIGHPNQRKRPTAHAGPGSIWRCDGCHNHQIVKGEYWRPLSRRKARRKLLKLSCETFPGIDRRSLAAQLHMPDVRTPPTPPTTKNRNPPPPPRDTD